MWQDATTANPIWHGWAASGTATATATTSTYYTNYYTAPGYAYVPVYPAPRKTVKKKQMPEPEPCTDEELEEFLFGGA